MYRLEDALRILYHEEYDGIAWRLFEELECRILCLDARRIESTQNIDCFGTIWLYRYIIDPSAYFCDSELFFVLGLLIDRDISRHEIIHILERGDMYTRKTRNTLERTELIDDDGDNRSRRLYL
jgi:hypothetical protein